jgi:drug/metabolite transporter (DMT)-like permease
MWTKLLTLVPGILGFLAQKSESNPRAALGATGGVAGLLGVFAAPEFQATLRNGLADILIAAADIIRQAPNAGS